MPVAQADLLLTNQLFRFSLRSCDDAKNKTKKTKGDDKIKHCKKSKIALYILYCEFRLCVTDAQIGADKGIGLSPYPVTFTS